ncbi:MAG: GNAT family N-acetyltransferase [Candidatus Promineofilum sp.]|nr:GNAT family N-acetyltransferase [Promineifilum sp.]
MSSHALELTKANRLRLARAFRHNPRVDCAIDCVLEAQMGQAFMDDPDRPTAYRITIGPFWYFAGDADGPGGRALLAEWPAYNLLMPSPPAWAAAAGELFGARLVAFPRYSFSADELNERHLAAVVAASPLRERVVAVDAALLARAAEGVETFIDLADFDSPDDFVARGLGYVALDGERVMGAAYSSLVCSRGIEVSLYVDEPYRRQGVATAIAGRLLLECVRQGRRPNWDAANLESCALAEKLGYVASGSYDSYFSRPQ